MKTPDMLDGVIAAALPFHRDYSVGIIVDNFAGGGGASTGIEAATGRDIDVAINHDEEAIAMHTANHPRTRHHCQSIWSIDPLDAVTIDGTPQPVRLAWFSPDCTHHSNARGGKPREKGIRDLAWVVVSWVERLGPKLKPAVIKVENVEEFLTWGPLDDEGKRIPGRNGEEFSKWIAALRRHGYKVEWKVLKASRYGTPTIRKRLCLIARCDGLPIVWPQETNGPGTPAPYRTAAECIDWSIPCPSIFLTKEEGRAIGVKRPLADATMARIAKGIQRYVIDAAQPFIVNLTHHGSERVESVEEPFKTITGAHRGEKALVVPIVSYAQQGGSNRSVEDPMHTICASTKDQNTVVAAHIMTMRNSGKPFNGADEPVHTITAHGAHLNVIAAHITKFHEGSVGHAADEPLHTITSNSYIKRPGGNVPLGIVAATMVQTGYGEREGQAARALDIEAPLGTVVAGGGKHAVVSAFLAQHNTMPNGGIHAGHSAEEPMSTVTTTGSHQGVVAAHLISLKGSDRRDGPVDEPVPAITAGGLHVGEVRAFLLKYYGGESSDEGHDIDAPLGSVTTRDRFGLVMVQGEPYQIVDIGMRMLTPRELFAAQGFPADYVIDPIGPSGKPLTKTAQIRMCGNSVCPPLAAALVRANYEQPAAAAIAA
ncbi:DNA (cytosine-5)-methyltransferase 1 [Sphingomonas aerolata]|uniref:DNA (cytosine-5-)-methyltransferase n=1 Tax=Sphingomonas aerolata TaxID=185951 RepID=A0A2T4YMU6_9SPHN|nr:DNA cytosine methyltransferase [Sphingomonas aerolata]PTM44734.1 DNA (cytosine-5)-methyltransferase 1 [Sphingomonas aerolata]